VPPEMAFCSINLTQRSKKSKKDDIMYHTASEKVNFINDCIVTFTDIGKILEKGTP
jgi:hypothetical protein